MAGGQAWRGQEIHLQFLLPKHGSINVVVACQDAVRGQKECRLAICQRAAYIGNALICSPDDVALGYIAAPIATDGKKLVIGVHDEDRATGIDRRRCGIAIKAVNSPDFLAGIGLISDYPWVGTGN